MRQAKVNICTHHTDNNQQEKIEYSVDAKIMQTKNYQVISYIDPSQKEENRTIIKSNEDEIRIIRQGYIESEMVFNRKEKSYGHYEVQGMVLDLQINLKDFIYKENLLKLDYDLFIDNHYSGLFETKIKITEKK